MSSPHNPNALSDSVSVSIASMAVVACIIFLFFAIVFVIVLHLYARWYWRRHPSRRRGFVFGHGGDAPVTPHRGLDASVLISLPIIAYRSADFKEGLECAVCLCEVSDGEQARLLPNCNHGFHLECIDMWFHSHSTCPLCRNPVAPQPPDCGGDSELPVSVMGESRERLSYPTNVLFWGTQNEVIAGRSSAEEGTSSSPDNMEDGKGKIVIDIPPRFAERGADASSPSSARLTEEEAKSPASRLRSLKRLLSRERRLVVLRSPRGGGDIEQGAGESNPRPQTSERD